MNDLKSFLDEKAEQYNHPDFVLGDPIQMLHRFELKQDIEIIGFLTATIAWGNRKSIIKSAEKMLMTMGKEFACPIRVGTYLIGTYRNAIRIYGIRIYRFLFLARMGWPENH